MKKKTKEILRSLGINPLRIQVMKDISGKRKGAAFVDFKVAIDTEYAIK